jgi:hypothetical protein
MDLFIYRLVLLIRCGGDAAGVVDPGSVYPRVTLIFHKFSDKLSPMRS